MTVYSKEALNDLMGRKDSLESEIRSIIRDLDSMGVGVSEALIDPEGFPRADVDLYRARSLRSNLIQKQNDFKALMKEIEVALPQAIPATTSNNNRAVQGNLATAADVPIAKIGAVPPNTPAFYNNLCPNDLIVKFGSIDNKNFSGNIIDFVEQIRHHRESRENLFIRVIRGGQMKTVAVEMAGVTSLGCQILPC